MQVHVLSTGLRFISTHLLYLLYYETAHPWLALGSARQLANTRSSSCHLVRALSAPSTVLTTIVARASCATARCRRQPHRRPQGPAQHARSSAPTGSGSHVKCARPLWVRRSNQAQQPSAQKQPSDHAKKKITSLIKTCGDAGQTPIPDTMTDLEPLGITRASSR